MFSDIGSVFVLKTILMDDDQEVGGHMQIHMGMFDFRVIYPRIYLSMILIRFKENIIQPLPYTYYSPHIVLVTC